MKGSLKLYGEISVTVFQEDVPQAPLGFARFFNALLKQQDSFSICCTLAPFIVMHISGGE